MSAFRPIWVVVDASNHIYSDFHAAGEKCLELTESRIELIAEHVRERNQRRSPDRVAVCFDSPTSFRKRIDTQYKAHRSVRPATVGVALANLRDYCLGSAIDVVECEDYEADDCIATIAAIGVSHGARVIICSSDKDLHQCLVPGLVTQLCKIKRERAHVYSQYMTAAGLADEYGITPAQWCDYQVLVGQPGDNVRGAQGIGPDTARRILRSCGSIEGYYENPWAANLTAKQMQKMQAFRPEWRTVDQLIRLRTDVPVAHAWKEAAV